MREKIENILSNAVKGLGRFFGKPEMSEELKPIRVPTDDKGAKPVKGRKL